MPAELYALIEERQSEHFQKFILVLAQVQYATGWLRFLLEDRDCSPLEIGWRDLADECPPAMVKMKVHTDRYYEIIPDGTGELSGLVSKKHSDRRKLPLLPYSLRN
jgi:hypothetical protein